LTASGITDGHIDRGISRPFSIGSASIQNESQEKIAESKEQKKPVDLLSSRTIHRILPNHRFTLLPVFSLLKVILSSPKFHPSTALSLL
jgi:hypothetical protein